MVSYQSLSFFSVFCIYGEREDSKSIMTDCFSLVSSDLHSSSLPKPFDLGMSKDTGRHRDMGKATLCTSGLFRQKQGNIATRMRNPSNVSPSSRNCKAPKISMLLEQPNIALKIKELAQNEIMDIDLTGKSLNWHKLGNFEKLHVNVRGEVVDLTDNPLLDENFPISDSMFFPNLMTDIEKDQIRKNMEINSSKTWRSMIETGEVENYAELNYGKDAFPLDFKRHENIGSTPVAIRNLGGLTFQEEMSHLSKAPLSRGQQSVGALKHSPWTAEPKVFKEKKRKRRMVSPTKKRGRNHSLLEYFSLL